MYLVHERAMHFRKTYGDDFTIEDSGMDQNLRGRCLVFIEKRNKKIYKFDEVMTDFVTSAKGIKGGNSWM